VDTEESKPSVDPLVHTRKTRAPLHAMPSNHHEETHGEKSQEKIKSTTTSWIFYIGSFTSYVGETESQRVLPIFLERLLNHRKRFFREKWPAEKNIEKLSFPAERSFLFAKWHGAFFHRSSLVYSENAEIKRTATALRTQGTME
jgi:hypothetical protein